MSYNSEMPSLCGVCKIPLISSMQIARSKQERNKKLVSRPFEPEANEQVQSPRSAKSKMKEEQATSQKKKQLCAGCDFEISKGVSEENYYSECLSCSSLFCR